MSNGTITTHINEEEQLKRAVYEAGVNALEEFLGHPLDDDNTNIWSEMNNVIGSMPDEEYDEYLKKYGIKKQSLDDYVSENGEYIIPVSWEVYSTITVKAKNLGEAVRIAKEKMYEIPLCKEAEYVEGSYKINIESDEDAIIAQEYQPIGDVYISDTQIRIFNIDWDTEPERVMLPKEIRESAEKILIPEIYEYDDITEIPAETVNERLNNYLSDKYGFLVKDYQYEII